MLNKKILTFILIFTMASIIPYQSSAAPTIIMPDLTETFVPEIKSVHAWLAGGQKSMTFNLNLEVTIKKNSLWKLRAHVGAISKSDQITCQIPNYIETKGEGGTPETGYMQPAKGETKRVTDGDYSLVTYELQSTSHVTGNGFPFCQSDYYLAYLEVISTSGTMDSYSLPFDTKSKKLLPLINLASPWAGWYPDKQIPPCKEPIRSDNYGVAWRTACQIGFNWPSSVEIESTQSADDLAAQIAADAQTDLKKEFESERQRITAKLGRHLQNRALPESYRYIIQDYLRQTSYIEVDENDSLASSLRLIQMFEIKADGLLSRIKSVTITCYKGKIQKIVKGSNPKCPSGFKKT